MGFAQVLSRAQAGLAAPQVTVEIHLGNGLPSFNIVGLPAAAVKESRERVRAALATCGFELPAGRITVNLAPADLPKEGGRYDLPIAIGVLLASGQIEPPFDVQRTEFYGELGLTGELKSVPGLLLAALHAAHAGHALVVPACNAGELGVASARVHALAQLRELVPGAEPVAHCASTGPSSRTGGGPVHGAAAPDIADVRGQHLAKRALLIAAAGGHSLLLLGPPGSGKTMLAQRLPGLLPPLDASQALEVAAIAAAAQAGAAIGGTYDPASPVAPPFRAPHHTASAHAIVGGGKSVQPGEVSLAHHGVLFLDELPEFDRRVLESLREPLESGRVSVVRANQRAEFPAVFQLVAAMNPCPCGRHGQARPPCRCSGAQIERYRARISGPLLDRIDLQLWLAPVDAQELAGHVLRASPGASDATGMVADAAGAASGPFDLTTAQARPLVERARRRQLQRQGCLNARLGAGETLRHCHVDQAARALLAQAAAKRGISARGQHRVLRVARSIADLEDRDAVRVEELCQALVLRLDESTPV